MDSRIGFCCRVFAVFQGRTLESQVYQIFFLCIYLFQAFKPKKKEEEKPSAMIILPKVVVWSQLMHFSLPRTIVGNRCFFRSTYFLRAV